MSTSTVQPGRSGRSNRSGGPAWVADLRVVLVWSVVAGVLGGLVWWLVTPLPVATRVGDAASLDPEQLTGEVAIDGWFAVIATVAGLLGGIALLAWRRRDPLVMVLLAVLGGGLSSWLMVWTGHLLGPGDVADALRTARPGAKASLPLSLRADGVVLLWPAATALGALVQLWVLRRDDRDEPAQDREGRADRSSGTTDVGDHGVQDPHEVGGRDTEVEPSAPAADPDGGQRQR